MKAYYLYFALGIAPALAACSNDDDTIMTPVASNEIRFTALAGAAMQRAAANELPGQQTTDNISSFEVWAYSPGSASAYMDGVDVTKVNGAWTYSPTMYWPVKPLSFYALYPIGFKPQYAETSTATLSPFSFTLENSGKIDVLYSVAADQTKEPEKAKQVQLNFRHALSQLQFFFSSTDKALESAIFNVRSVKVKDMFTQAMVTLPAASTLPNNVASSGDTAPANASIVAESGSKQDIAVATGDKVLPLTSSARDANDTGYYYFVPQTLADSNVLEVEMQVLNPTNRQQIWPADSDYGTVTYKLSTDAIKEFKQGHRYVYNIAVTKVAGLEPIEFDVTVDDYNLNTTTYEGPATPQN